MPNPEKNVASLHSFTFFAKERCILCLLFRSLEKNRKERSVLLGLIIRQKLEKRMEKIVGSLKERKRTAVPNPEYAASNFLKGLLY